MNNKDDEVEQTPMEDRKYDTSNDNSDDSTDNGSNESKSPENDSDYKLSCKYRKSCYTKGKRYIILKALHQKSESKKKTELHCKYRKSCYETGKRPEINHKLFTQMEELVKKIYGTADSEEPASTEQNKKLFCKYRKSCYNTGKLQLPKLEHLKTLAVTKSDAVNTQLRCKYRKSCYQNSNIVLDKKTEKLKNSAEREVINIETQENRQHVTSFKSNDEKRKGTNEKKVKKDNQHRSNESEDEEDIKKSRKKDKDENKNDHKENKRNTEQILDNEQIYKQIQVNEAEEQLNDKRILNTKDKLSCKYRKRCYDNLDPIDGFKSAAGIELSKHKAAQLISMKGLMRPNGRPCSAYYISCRKLVGLPVRQRPPIGPNGKRLCRKKPKTTTASNIN